MDRAKAINIMKDLHNRWATWRGVSGADTPEVMQAITMAIAALREQERNEQDCAKDAHYNEWISVKERLPEYNELVLVVWVKHDRIRRRGFGTLQREGVWYVSNEGMPPVTHWMPLPEPPKEGAEE